MSTAQKESRQPKSEGGGLDGWKQDFLDKLHHAQAACARQFEDALDIAVTPVFEEMATFLRDNSFTVSTPLSESGRRSFKFELAENAYLLAIFRFTSVGEFELRCETFVPGSDPVLEKSVGRITDVNADWARKQFATGLDRFVELLGSNQRSPTDAVELIPA